MIVSIGLPTIKREVINETEFINARRRLDTVFSFQIDDLTPVSYVAETKNLLS